MDTAIFGAGCFWGIEAAFRAIDGVIDVAVGYSGGNTVDPAYKQVCAGDTGHAEVVQVQFDPGQLTYNQLLDAFWNCHDATQLNRQGPDVGTQYRSVIFYHNDEQRQLAEGSKEALREKGVLIATEISPLSTFYRAEEYHQRYLEKNGRSSCGI